jgi:hypothetical protein
MGSLVAQIDGVKGLQQAAEVLAACEAAHPVLGDDDTPDEVADALLRLLERSAPAAASSAIEGLVDKALGRDELVWASLRRQPTATTIGMAGYDHVDLDALRDAMAVCPPELTELLAAKIADVEDMDDLDDDGDDDE